MYPLKQNPVSLQKTSLPRMNVRYVHLLLTRMVATALKGPGCMLSPWLTLCEVHPPRTPGSGKTSNNFLTRRHYKTTSACPSHNLARYYCAGWAGSLASRRAVTRIGALSSLGCPPHDPRCSVSGRRSGKCSTMEVAEVATRLPARIESIRHSYA